MILMKKVVNGWHFRSTEGRYIQRYYSVCCLCLLMLISDSDSMSNPIRGRGSVDGKDDKCHCNRHRRSYLCCDNLSVPTVECTVFATDGGK